MSRGLRSDRVDKTEIRHCDSLISKSVNVNSDHSRDLRKRANTMTPDSSHYFSIWVRVFGVRVFSFEPDIESRDMSREYLLFRRVLKLATPPQTSKTDSEKWQSSRPSSRLSML